VHVRKGETDSRTFSTRWQAPAARLPRTTIVVVAAAAAAVAVVAATAAIRALLAARLPRTTIAAAAAIRALLELHHQRARQVFVRAASELGGTPEHGVADLERRPPARWVLPQPVEPGGPQLWQEQLGPLLQPHFLQRKHVGTAGEQSRHNAWPALRPAKGGAVDAVVLGSARHAWGWVGGW